MNPPTLLEAILWGTAIGAILWTLWTLLILPLWKVFFSYRPEKDFNGPQ